jgi:hypothetical protein
MTYLEQGVDVVHMSRSRGLERGVKHIATLGKPLNAHVSGMKVGEFSLTMTDDKLNDILTRFVDGWFILLTGN